MPRRSRRDAPGRFHHVFNRGQSRRPVFEGQDDVRYFLSQAARQVHAGRIRIHSYCMMTNHYHLLVESVGGELSRALATIQLGFVRWFNRSRGRSGSLFEGRFRSRPILTDAYWHAVHAYIDSNPVSAGMMTNATLHPAGSAWHYARPARPIWLTRSRVERIVTLSLGWPSYEPDLYATWCEGVRDEDTLRLIENRMVRASYDEDPLDALKQSSERVKQWMKSRARLADGHDSQPPLASDQKLMAVVAQRRLMRPEWQVVPSVRHKSAWLVISVGLVSYLCRTRQQDIARQLEIATGSVHTYLQDFHQLVGSDTEFLCEATSLVSETLA